MCRYLFEIKNKFILLLITFFSMLFVCYWYKAVLLFLVTQMHLNDENLYFIFTNVTELFSVYFKLVLFILIQIIAWYLFHHLFSFLCPALYLREFRFVSFFFKSITFFWLLAGFLSSYILIPFSWRFFLGFQIQQDLYFEGRIGEYFSFYSNVYFLCLIYCQLLILLFFFLTDVRRNSLYIKKSRKLYYYIFLIFSTLVTPPDLISQIITTFFIIVVYEAILLVSMLNFFFNNLNQVTD